jgi:hypothetical protein
MEKHRRSHLTAPIPRVTKYIMLSCLEKGCESESLDQRFKESAKHPPERELARDAFAFGSAASPQWIISDGARPPRQGLSL